MEKDLGTIEPGHLADLIITAGDPLTDINDLGELRSVAEIAKPFATLPENSVYNK